MAKQIRELKIKVGELRSDFGNPKKITKKELERLKTSILENGDFGVFVINEENQILSGNQRQKAMLELGMGDKEVLCKQLVGYSQEEQKRVLLEANATRGQYILKDLEELLKGTSLNMENFNIASALASSEFSQQTYKASEIKIIPLTVATTEEEYDAFIVLQKKLGVKSPAQVVKKILKEKADL